MAFRLIIYFIAGVCQDFLLTLNWRFINKEKIIPAALFSFAVTIVSMLVLYNILTELDEQRSIISIVIYALGIGTGTILGMKTKIGGKNK
ncbi:hypothetical protein COU00_00975 [Candidatus Falkowbacteria bacterium CG10_big_fil_rev_8_21_14_0_10_43_11]|uniref:DUF5698 domain-containing protein n=1 Tax=Candidatus Falkowbacteria bacterium CG10_big_fil_rev_8_21_14_0_10_43_11 TaxID=1974568 RepID=A0A2M6WMR1_9BACT|nr:MAG: hypothetical protein COU00_00975 [Candidatus Falkowbacteria bacterium CG10_big_fil_rev_8_21_14_0_10_43_11]